MANIKYKENGEYKDIVVKVGDTSPIGLEADYDGTEVPNGWEEVTDSFSGTLAENVSKTFSLKAYTNYILVATSYGQGSASINTNVFIVSTGQNASKTSQAIKVGGSNSELLTISFTDGLTMVITSKSGIWNIVSLTRI
jgi:hypothetical protein